MAYDDLTKQRCVAALATGRSARDVAREHLGKASLGVTVTRWAKEAEALAPEPHVHAAPAPAPEPPAPAADELAGATADELRRMVADTLRLARAAEAGGHYQAAQRARRDAAGLMPVVLRAESAEREGADVLHLSRAEIDAAMREVWERVAAVAARGILCAHCSRELSIAWAQGRNTGPSDDT